MTSDPVNTAYEKGKRTLLSTLYGLVVMGRPADGMIIGGAVVLGMIAGTLALPPFEHMFLGFLGGVFLLGSMDTFNDYRDRSNFKAMAAVAPRFSRTSSRLTSCGR